MITISTLRFAAADYSTTTRISFRRFALSVWLSGFPCEAGTGVPIERHLWVINGGEDVRFVVNKAIKGHNRIYWSKLRNVLSTLLSAHEQCNHRPPPALKFWMLFCMYRSLISATLTQRWAWMQRSSFIERKKSEQILDSNNNIEKTSNVSL